MAEERRPGLGRRLFKPRRPQGSRRSRRSINNARLYGLDNGDLGGLRSRVEPNLERLKNPKKYFRG